MLEMIETQAPINADETTWDLLNGSNQQVSVGKTRLAIYKKVRTLCLRSEGDILVWIGWGKSTLCMVSGGIL